MCVDSSTQYTRHIIILLFSPYSNTSPTCEEHFKVPVAYLDTDSTCYRIWYSDLKEQLDSTVLYQNFAHIPGIVPVIVTVRVPVIVTARVPEITAPVRVPAITAPVRVPEIAVPVRIPVIAVPVLVGE